MNPARPNRSVSVKGLLLRASGLVSPPPDWLLLGRLARFLDFGPGGLQAGLEEDVQGCPLVTHGEDAESTWVDHAFDLQGDLVTFVEVIPDLGLLQGADLSCPDVV